MGASFKLERVNLNYDLTTTARLQSHAGASFTFNLVNYALTTLARLRSLHPRSPIFHTLDISTSAHLISRTMEVSGDFSQIHVYGDLNVVSGNQNSYGSQRGKLVSSFFKADDTYPCYKTPSYTPALHIWRTRMS